MKETIRFKDSCEFKTNIAEITSISLECQYELEDNGIDGTFLIEGNYRTHELSINQEPFSFKLPFEYKFLNRIKENTENVNVLDFTYSTMENTLEVEIEYEVEGEEMEEEFTTQDDFDRFLTDHEVEIVDLNEDDEKNKEDSTLEDISSSIDEEIPPLEDPLQVEEERGDININTSANIGVFDQAEANTTSDMTPTANSVIEKLEKREDEYITYHVYVASEYDTLESISTKFKIDKEIIKNYNSFDSINPGMKLIIPSNE